MCSNETFIVADPVDVNTESVPQKSGSITTPNAAATFESVEQHRYQLYNYTLRAERLRFVQNYASYPRWAFPVSINQNRLTKDEPKPQHSYIGLIAMGILSSPESKLVLSDIYQYILDSYPYFRNRGPGWRNSIRHNLSLNDCFIKAERSANGKGHYWAIHPANVDDFKKGDFRRRKAQRKVRKHMELAADNYGIDSFSPPPHTSPPNLWTSPIIFSGPFPTTIPHKRQFDVASLLAPDDNGSAKKQVTHLSSSSEEEDAVDIDGVKSDPAVSNSQKQSPSLQNDSTSSRSAWYYSNILNTMMPDHQQLLAKYYEQLNKAQIIQLSQQIQTQKSFCNTRFGYDQN